MTTELLDDLRARLLAVRSKLNRHEGPEVFALKLRVFGLAQEATQVVMREGTESPSARSALGDLAEGVKRMEDLARRLP
jgi:hypothetical protein